MNLLELTQKAFEKSQGKLVGDVLFVEHIPEEEVKTAGGIVLASGQRQLGAFDSDRPHFVRVLAVGEGFYNDETGEDVPLEYKPGNVLLLPLNSVKYYSSFGTYIGRHHKHKRGEGFGIGVSKAGEEWMKFETEDNYRTFMNYYGPEGVKSE